MENLPIEDTQPDLPDNVVFIDFFGKKSFPIGEWSSEPDYCEWQSCGLHCLSIRDMKLGSSPAWLVYQKNIKHTNYHLMN